MNRFACSGYEAIARLAVTLAVTLTTALGIANCATTFIGNTTIRSGTQFSLTGQGAAVYFDLQGILWKIPAEGGKAVPLSSIDDDVRHPQLSPDGNWLAAQSFATGAWDIVIMQTDGSLRRNLTNTLFDDQTPVWSNDGKTILFASDRTGNEDIWSIDVESGKLSQVTADPADDYAPVLSDTKLYFVSDRSRTPNVYSAELDQADITASAIAAAPAGQMSGARVSPDQQSLAWVQAVERNGFPGVARNELVVHDLASGKTRALRAAGVDIFSMPPVWLSSDRLLYAADGLIRTLSLSGEAASVIDFSAQLPFKTKRFRPDLPIAFRNMPQPVRGIVDPVMLFDETIVFTALGDLWLLSSAGELESITNDKWMERDVTVSPDGKTLAYISDRDGSTQIWLHDLATNARSRITDNSSGPRYPTFSPDGKFIAYQQVGPIGVQDFTVRILELATGKSRKLRSSPKIWPGRMGWTADKKHLIVAELAKQSGRASDGRNRLVRINVRADVAGKTELPDTLTPDTGPAISPNGQQMALVINGSLWTLALTQGGLSKAEPVLLLDELVESPTWSADGKHILVLTSAGLEQVDIQTGERTLRSFDKTWQPATGEARRLIHAGRVWDGASDSYRYNVDILLDGARIIAVTPHKAHGDRRVIDAADQVVMPGLIDHHVHFQPHDGEWVGRALLAFGVTTVVEPGGLPYESREHMESWLTGKRLGPRLVFAGPQLDGHRRTFNFASHIESEQRLQRELVRGERLGYGLIKTYRRLRPDLQARTVELAHERGLPVTAHAALRNLGNGGDRTEHLRGSSRLSYSTKQSDLLLSYADVQSVYRLAGASGGALTPTIVNQGGFFDFALKYDLDEFENYARIYSPAYRKNLAGFVQFTSKRIVLIREGLANAGQTLNQLQQADVRILAGTDSPIFPYGIALVAELKNYVDAGFSPADALRTATLNPALALGAEDMVGQIKAGMLADLIIVDGDPLTSIVDIANVTRVVVNGRPISIAALTQPD